MIKLSAFLRQRDELESRLSEAPRDIEARVALARLFTSMGLRAAALAEYTRAGEDGASFELVGHQVATLTFELGSIADAISYLKAGQRKAKQPATHQALLKVLLASEAGARAYDALRQKTALPIPRLLLALTAYFAARRHGSIIEMIPESIVDLKSHPRAETAFLVAKAEQRRRQGKLPFSHAIRAARLYARTLRMPERAAELLSEIDAARVKTDADLARLTDGLLSVGAAAPASYHAWLYLQRNPASTAARGILISCAHLLDDSESVRAAAGSGILADDITKAADVFSKHALHLTVPVEASPRLYRTLARLLLALADAERATRPETGAALTLASYFVDQNDPTALIALSDRTLTIGDLAVSPAKVAASPTARAGLWNRLAASRLTSLSDVDAPFPMTSLAEACVRHEGMIPPEPKATDTLTALAPAWGTFRPASPARLIGSATDGWTERDFSKPFDTVPVNLARLGAARLVGRGFLVTADGKAVADVQADGIRRSYEAGHASVLKARKWLKARTAPGIDGRSIRYVGELSGKVGIVEPSCYLLDNGQGYNFANWHMYVFPRLFGYFAAGLDRLKVKLVLYAGTSERMLAQLMGYGFSRDDFVFHDEREISLFSDLFVPSAMSDVERLLAPQAFRTFDRLSEASLIASGAPDQSLWRHGNVPRKVYLSRADVPRRRLVNEAKIERIARDAGFEIIFPASLSLVDVVKLYRNVDVICGPSGSSFLNMLYMKNGSQAVMISHPLYSPTAYLCCQFGGLRGIEPTVIFGRVVAGEASPGEQEAFAVDEAAVRETLAAI